MTDRLPRRVVLRAFATFVAGALAACGPLYPTPRAPSSRPAVPSPTPIDAASAGGSKAILMLLGTPGHMRLGWFDGGLVTPIPLPDDDVRWVSGSPASGLVATVGAAGRIFVAPPAGATDRPTWREIEIGADARRWLGQPLADATADPMGESIAVVAGDPAAGFADGHLVILHRSGGRVQVVSLPGRWDGRAPAWLGAARIAVSTRDRSDAPGLSIVEPAGSGSVRWGNAIGAYAASSDGLTLAWQEGDDRRVFVSALAAALAGEPADSVPIDPPARLAAQLLLDATGGRLAIVWLDVAGDTTTYSTYRWDAAGWALVHAGALPLGTSRAILVDLGP